jgi:hypothetical protein
MREFPIIRAKPEHPHAWLWEPLETEPSFELRSMFGAKAVYLSGKLQLCFTVGEEPWRGVLICTDKERQPSLIEEFPALRPHPILPKWLYLPESCEAFEAAAGRIVALVRKRDARIGVLAKPKRTKRKTWLNRKGAKQRR